MSSLIYVIPGETRQSAEEGKQTLRKNFEVGVLGYDARIRVSFRIMPDIEGGGKSRYVHALGVTYAEKGPQGTQVEKSWGRRRYVDGNNTTLFETSDRLGQSLPLPLYEALREGLTETDIRALLPHEDMALAHPIDLHALSMQFPHIRVLGAGYLEDKVNVYVGGGVVSRPLAATNQNYAAPPTLGTFAPGTYAFDMRTHEHITHLGGASLAMELKGINDRPPLKQDRDRWGFAGQQMVFRVVQSTALYLCEYFPANIPVNKVVALSRNP